MLKKRVRTQPVVRTNLPRMGRDDAPIVVVLDPVVSENPFPHPMRHSDIAWLGPRLRRFSGFDKTDVQFISCAPSVNSDTWGKQRLLNQHLKDHYEDFHQYLSAVKPKLIIPMGAKAAQQVIGRSVQITKMRGQITQDERIAGGTPVLPMTSPFFAQRHPDSESIFNTDLETAGRLHSNKYDVERSIKKTKKNYKWCYDLQWLIDLKPSLLSVDCETLGLKAFDPNTRILTVQLTWKPGYSVCIPIDYDADDLRHHKSRNWNRGQRAKLVAQLKTLLENPRIKKFGHNFKFDFLMLKFKLDIDVQNYSDDTILLSHLWDENLITRNLDDLIRLYVPEMAGYNDVLNKDPIHQGKTRMDLLPPDKMLTYACGDTDAAYRLRTKLRKLVRSDKRLWACYEHVTMPGIRAFCEIEQIGFAVSRDELIKFEKQLAAHQKKERVRLLKMIPQSIKDKHRDTGVGLKPDRRCILVDYLYEHPDGLRLEPVVRTKTGEPSVSSKQALPYYVADHPFVADVMQYIKNEKMLTTYAAGFHKYIYNDLVRPSYGLHKTSTGRTASEEPNGQNFPKRGALAKQYRRIFSAPKGYVYVQLDLSQAELRIAAMLSGDPTMLQVYRDGGDIHQTTAMAVMGLSSMDEWNALPKEMRSLKRFQAKAVNFGFIYGMWWVKFRQYAKTEYGIDFTEDEARQIRELFFATYTGLGYWHNDAQDFVLEHGYVRAFDGRVRHLPNVRSKDESVRKQAIRQAINSPVQSIASDIGVMTLGRLIPYLKRTGKDRYIKVCGFVHDSIVALVREDKVAEALRTIKRFMEGNPFEEWFDWKPEIPITADAEIGRNLADTHEIDFRYFSKESGNRSYGDILSAIGRDQLEAARAAGDAEKLAKAEAAYNQLQADATGRPAPSGRVDHGSRRVRKPRLDRHGHGELQRTGSKDRNVPVGRPVRRRIRQTTG